MQRTFFSPSLSHSSSLFFLSYPLFSLSLSLASLLLSVLFIYIFLFMLCLLFFWKHHNQSASTPTVRKTKGARARDVRADRCQKLRHKPPSVHDNRTPDEMPTKATARLAVLQTQLHQIEGLSWKNPHPNPSPPIEGLSWKQRRSVTIAPMGNLTVSSFHVYCIQYIKQAHTKNSKCLSNYCFSNITIQVSRPNSKCNCILLSEMHRPACRVGLCNYLNFNRNFNYWVKQSPNN